ncbi:nonribosomal peptide synthase [Penicillium odoratum]|uniref:nonribosomal peptide synthase n=1 Tax=Penicillium odoratum TaxID=1167516 RepID=UPI00254978A9|nr:nonribosomal peptide synthase [Penicillium odoratum]KAJ5751666.1 nonribosomal peptide synthase [Penicillium odoratum]
MTYSELEAQARALSLRLVQAGAGPEVVVPVLFERSGWTPVAMLAVLYSGAAFALFDPSFPDGRLKTMCSDIGAMVGVCSPQYAYRGKSIGLQQVITPRITVSKASDIILPRTVRPGNMAILAFTSGSTGKPKATVIEHAAFSTSLIAIAKKMNYLPTSRVLQFASYGFDTSISETLGVLIGGGCVCVPSEQERQQDLGGVTRRLNVNTTFMTPAVLRTFNPDDFPTISTVVCGGEKIAMNDIQSWAEKKTVANIYGPSECSIGSSFASSLSFTPDTANIGYPTECCHFWVVDQDDTNRLVPVGAVGELIIEGPNVGREYFNRPEQTAQAFFRNTPWIRPFRTSQWSFYRTGDLVQMVSDGSFRILGRKDNQVKIHGQRIELEEIEHVIHDALPESQRVIVAVVSRTSPVLVAFLLGMNGDTCEKESAKSTFLKPSKSFQHACRVAVATRLQRDLPQFMIPKLWIPLDKLPLTPNDKLDFRLLSAEVAQFSSEEAFEYGLSMGNRRTVAHDEMENRIQSLVALVLGVEKQQVALDASFFAQGGDSLAAMRISALAGKENIELSPLALQEAETIAKLAQKLDKEKQKLGCNEKWAPQFLQDTDGTVLKMLSCQFPGIGSLNIQHILAGTEMQGYFLDLPCEYFRLNLCGSLDICRLKSAIKSLHERHEILRTVVFGSDTPGRTYQVIVRDFEPQLEILESTEPAIEVAGRWIVNDNEMTKRSMRSLWPPARFFLAMKDDDTRESSLVVGIKHTHYDAVSIITLFSDLATFYEHGPDSLPPAMTFGEYQAFAASLPMSDAMDFWQETLRGSSLFDVGRCRVLSRCPVVDTSRVIPLVQPPLGITLATVVKTAWGLTLAHQAGKDDCVFAQFVTGRSQGPTGIQEVVGPCVNSIPVRVSLAGEKPNLSAMEVMEAVQSQHVESLFYETIEFTKLGDQCTEWGLDALIETYIMHQNITPDNEYRLGEAVGKMDMIYLGDLTDGFVLYSVPRVEDHEFRLSIPEGVLDLATASHLVTETCYWVQTLVAHPNTSVAELRTQRKADMDSAMNCE